MLTSEGSAILNERISDEDKKTYVDCHRAIAHAMGEVRERQKELADCSQYLWEKYVGGSPAGSPTTYGDALREVRKRQLERDALRKAEAEEGEE